MIWANADPHIFYTILALTAYGEFWAALFFGLVLIVLPLLFGRE